MAAPAGTFVEQVFSFSSCAPPPALPLHFLSLVADKCAYAFCLRETPRKTPPTLPERRPVQHRRSSLHPAVVSDSSCLISTPNHSKGTGSDSLDSKPSWQRRPADIITGLVSELFSLLSL